jgi:hypothetical protein
LAAHRPETERLEVFETTELLEGFSAAVDRNQPGLLQLPGLDLPQGFSLQRAVPDQRERVGVLGFAPGQALGGVDYPGQFVTSAKFAVLGGNSAGDLLQLRMVRQVMVDSHEEFVEFRGWRGWLSGWGRWIWALMSLSVG